MSQGSQVLPQWRISVHGLPWRLGLTIWQQWHTELPSLKSPRVSPLAARGLSRPRERGSLQRILCSKKEFDSFLFFPLTHEPNMHELEVHRHEARSRAVVSGRPLGPCVSFRRRHHGHSPFTPTSTPTPTPTPWAGRRDSASCCRRTAKHFHRCIFISVTFWEKYEPP